MQTIIELREGYDVWTPLGHGTCLIIFAPSYMNNSLWMVKLDNGEVKHFDSNDIRMSGSPTYGEQGKPNLPPEWNRD